MNNRPYTRFNNSSSQGVEEAVGDPPSVPAFAEHEPLHPELQRRFPHP